jgi:hypothetical protein
MKIIGLCTGANGESQFEDTEVEAGKLQPGDGIIFRDGTPDHVNSWHRAPRRQYVINLSGETEIEISDGTKRRFGPVIFFSQRIPPVVPFLRGTSALSRVA